jgi:hypothetical protein
VITVAVGPPQAPSLGGLVHCLRLDVVTSAPIPEGMSLLAVGNVPDALSRDHRLRFRQEFGPSLVHTEYVLWLCRSVIMLGTMGSNLDTVASFS